VSYTANKGGVLALSRELGVEFARRGVRVNALCPGPVNTPLLQELFAIEPERTARRLVHVPIGRFAEPDEIAAAMACLASDGASFITASTFLVDCAFRRLTSPRNRTVQDVTEHLAECAFWRRHARPGAPGDETIRPDQHCTIGVNPQPRMRVMLQVKRIGPKTHRCQSDAKRCGYYRSGVTPGRTVRACQHHKGPSKRSSVEIRLRFDSSQMCGTRVPGTPMNSCLSRNAISSGGPASSLAAMTASER
jgi:hypothetical protein